MGHVSTESSKIAIYSPVLVYSSSADHAQVGVMLNDGSVALTATDDQVHLLPPHEPGQVVQVRPIQRKLDDTELSQLAELWLRLGMLWRPPRMPVAGKDAVDVFRSRLSTVLRWCFFLPPKFKAWIRCDDLPNAASSPSAWIGQVYAEMSCSLNSLRRQVLMHKKTTRALSSELNQIKRQVASQGASLRMRADTLKVYFAVPGLPDLVSIESELSQHQRAAALVLGEPFGDGCVVTARQLGMTPRSAERLRAKLRSARLSQAEPTASSPPPVKEGCPDAPR